MGDNGILGRVFCHRPKLTLPETAATVELLRQALAEYGVTIAAHDSDRQLRTLKVDDIDLVEAVQLVEAATGGKISKRSLKPEMTVGELAAMLDAVRTTPHS